MFPTTSPGRALALGLAALLVIHGCGGETTGPGPGPDPDPTSTVRVTATTTGASLDDDGYVVQLDGLTRSIEANGSVLFEDVEPGTHTVQLTGVAARCAVTGESSLDVVAPAGAVADVTFEVECGRFVQVPCPALELESTTGLPLDEVSLGTLPASFDLPVAASVSVDGTTPAGLAFVRSGEPDGGAGPHLVVPLHPVTPLEGGVVHLTVSDGTSACAPVDFTIQPLPAADGELEAVVDLLQAILTEQADHLGTTPEALVASPLDEIPPELWPLALAQTVLDDPSNPQSLRAAAEGTLGEEVTDWLDRLVARTGVRSSLEMLPPPAPERRPRAFADVSDLQCSREFVNGSDASVLEGCMAAAAEARRAASGISKKVSEDIGTALSAVGDFADFYGVPLVDVVDAMFSAFFWLIYNEREKTAAVYPSRFTSMTLEVDRTRFAEDEDAEGRVTRAEVTATNEGYDLQKVIFEALEEGFSLAQATGKFDFSTWEPIDKAFGKLQPLIKRRLAELEIEDLQIPVESFGPVDLADPEWIQARVAAGEAIEIVDEIGYRPRLWGPATLSVRTFDGKFGGQQIAGQVEITVPAIQMIITPKDTVVAPSEPGRPNPVTLEVTVLESASPDSVELDQSEHPRQGEAHLTVNQGSNVHQVTYIPPVDPDFDAPDLVVVRHTARAGARKNGPPRTATATLRFGDLTISPRSACLDPGDPPLKFEAEVEGVTDAEVRWEASVGDIDDDGSYSAPPTPPAGGEATITAFLADRPELRDSVTIHIGGCSCAVSVTVDGVADQGEGLPGFDLAEGGTVVKGMFSFLEAVGDVGGNVSWGFAETPSDPTYRPVGTTGGPFSVVVDGTQPGVGPYHSYFTPEGEETGLRVQATLTENDGNVLAGRLDGSVWLWYEDRAGTFSMEFRIVADPAVSDALERRCILE